MSLTEVFFIVSMVLSIFFAISFLSSSSIIWLSTIGSIKILGR